MSLKLAGESTFDDVYDELFPSVFRYTKLRVPEPEVEDVMAEIMVRIWQSLEGFAGKSSLKSWAFTIAARTVADYYRKGKDRELTPLSADSAVAQNFEDDLTVALAVTEVMTRLPEPHLSVIQLRLIEGFDADQTASFLGISRQAVDSLLYRARKKFQTLYAQATAGGEV